MKKKLLSVMLVVCLVAMSLVALVGCKVTYVSIRVDDSAMKTDYVEGEALSYDGLKVYATTDKEEEVELTAEEYTVSVDAGTKINKKTTITVALAEDPSITAKITVKCHNDIVGAEIKTHATKLEYLVGERFDATGLVVTVTRENGDKEDLTEGFVYSTEPLTADDTTIEITVGTQKVTENVTIIRGVFIEAEDGRIDSATVQINSDSPAATGGYYVGELRSSDKLTFMFSASAEGKADITFRLASVYIKEDVNWDPVWMGDCQLNKIMKVYVNGVEQVISDEIILPGGGGPGGEPNDDLWFNWKDVVFGEVDLVEGTNEIQIEFIPHDYADCSQASFNNVFTANVDSMKVTTNDIDISPVIPPDDGINSYEITNASLAEVDGKATLVLEGSYEAGADATSETIATALGNTYCDFQQNPYMAAQDWNGSWTAFALTCIEVTVDEANNTFVAKYDLSELAAWAYTGHYGAADSSGDLKPSCDSFSKVLTVGNMEYTLSYEIGGGDNAFWGCVGLTIAEVTAE